VKKLEKVYDNNYLEISYYNLKYGIITLIMVIVILFVLLIIRKNYYYINSISFTGENTGVIIVDKSRINDIKEINKMILGDMVISYNVEKILEKDDVYLLDVKFEEELEVNTNIYKVVLFKENILEYIIRIMKGDLK